MREKERGSGERSRGRGERLASHGRQSPTKRVRRDERETKMRERRKI